MEYSWTGITHLLSSKQDQSGRTVRQDSARPGMELLTYCKPMVVEVKIVRIRHS